MKPSLYAVAASLYLAEYTLYSNSSATVLLNASISDYFHLPYGVTANVGVAFLAGFCATLLPAGLLLHRCRPVTTFYVSSAALAVLGIAASLSPAFWVLIVIRFLQGATSALLAPQLFRIARQQFYPDHHTAFLGTWGLVVSGVGAVFAVDHRGAQRRVGVACLPVRDGPDHRRVDPAVGVGRTRAGTRARR